MSNAADAPIVSRWFTFAQPPQVAGFLLTCLDEPNCGPGTTLYDRQLDKLHYAPRLNRIFLQIQAPREVAQLVASMALANSGEVTTEPPPSNSRLMTKLQFLQSVMLQPQRGDARTDQLLAGFRSAQPEQLGMFLDDAGQLGVKNIEVAFVAGSSHYSHFIRLRGVRDLKAFTAGTSNAGVPVDFFLPVRSERAIPRFYVKWGHRFPLQGLERLARIDSELVLLQPSGGEKRSTQWIHFAPGEANFFRRMAECVDLELGAHDIAPVELREDAEPRRVPMEIALTPRPQGPPVQLVEMDRQIDRYQRLLSDLNRSRERLVSSDTNEVYFAYAFDQPEGESLNPALTVLLQQRVGVLRNCSYAFCQPRNGQLPFHLVMARRPQRYEGFSLQSADRVYFQPAAWQQAEVPLYLPWGMELAPRIDSRDAVELLHRFLEESNSQQNSSRGSGALPPIAECKAVLWDRGHEGEILETRVRSLAGLLDQFQLFNSFRRDVATQVAQSTRKELEEGLRESRTLADSALDRLTQELYDHVGTRTTKLEQDFQAMVQQLDSATKLVDQVEQYARRVTDLIEKVPTDWATFVTRVIEVHRAISEPSYAAYQELRSRLQPTADELRMLALRGRNLAELALQQRQRLEQRLEECNQMVVQTDNSRQAMEEVAPQVAAVAQQVVSTHGTLRTRLQAIQTSAAEADRMEQEIDRCEEREREVKERVEQILPEYQRCERLDAELKRLDQDLSLRDEELRQRTLEINSLQQIRASRTRQIAAQLQAMEVQLRRLEADRGQTEQLSTRLEQEMQLLATQGVALDRWDSQAQAWQQDLQSQLEQLRNRLAGAQGSGEVLGEAGSLLQQAAELVARGEQLLQASEAVREKELV